MVRRTFELRKKKEEAIIIMIIIIKHEIKMNDVIVIVDLIKYYIN